jgi:hypothetical protein
LPELALVPARELSEMSGGLRRLPEQVGDGQGNRPTIYFEYIALKFENHFVKGILLMVF